LLAVAKGGTQCGQSATKSFRALEALFPISLASSLDDLAKLDGYAHQRGFKRVRPYSSMPCQHLEQDDTDSIEVGAVVDFSRASLLRRHIVQRPGLAAIVRHSGQSGNGIETDADREVDQPNVTTRAMHNTNTVAFIRTSLGEELSGVACELLGRLAPMPSQG
jgi:hypothetical protein